MSDRAEYGSEVHRMPDSVEFAFEKGQAFKVRGADRPEDYVYVRGRVWNVDTDPDDYVCWEQKHKQYYVGEVQPLGGDPRLVSELDLEQHYIPVEKDEVEEVVL